MAYCDIDDISKMLPEIAIIQLTDDEGAGEADAEKVAEAIEQADSEIDSYCSTRYDVPFSPVPDLIRKLSVDLAIYNLYSRKVEEIPEARQTRYNNAIRLLKDIAAGKASIDESIEIEDEILASGSEEDRKFTMGKKSDGSSGTLDNY